VESTAVKYFNHACQAKEFLVAQIVQQAQLEGVPLSEIEQKMLYFTESGWTLPNIMEVAEKFDEEYDQDEYEKKIAKLVKSAAKRAMKRPGDDYAKWWEAIRLLGREDHYISVMINGAGLRPRGDQPKLLATALSIVGAFVVALFLWIKYGTYLGKYFPNGDALQRLFWGTLVCVAALYVVARLLFGARVDNLLLSLTLRLMGKSELADKIDQSEPARFRIKKT
jgi:hypothetical protein